MNPRHKQPPHPYRIEYFEELPPKIFGPDNLCTCNCAEYCPLGRKGIENRCTLKELQKLDEEAIRRRAWQSGE